MIAKIDINNSECQNALKKQGYYIGDITFKDELKLLVECEKYDQIDTLFKRFTSVQGEIFDLLAKFCPVKEIEFIISLRDAKNEWEEDGIWHDDGSRVLAFSLSLTLEKPEGGILEFRKKGEFESQKIRTPEFGKIIIFKTGTSGFEHKINAVTKGKRLIIAGWCYDKPINL